MISGGQFEFNFHESDLKDVLSFVREYREQIFGTH